MNVMVVGGGGREHAIIKALKKNPAITTLYALPGNGGISADATCVDIGAKDLDGIVAFATSHAIDFAVVAPDDPLVWALSEAAGFLLRTAKKCGHFGGKQNFLQKSDEKIRHSDSGLRGIF